MDKKIIIKRYFYLLMIYTKMELALLFRDTKAMIIYIVSDAVASIATITGIFLLAIRFNGIGNMNEYEVLFMLGYVTILTGVFEMFSSGNVGHISRRIGRGQFEHMFIQPVPMPMQLGAEAFAPFTQGSNFVCGLVIVNIAINQLGLVVPVWWVLLFALNIFLSFVILMCQSYLYSTSAFYAPVACEEISMLVIDQLSTLKNYPLAGMPKWIKTPLISIFPYGLMGWFPSMILLGKSPFEFANIYQIAIAVILFIITYFTFKKGFTYYVKKGSSRYSNFGHR